jgi:protein-S-isoprenylcysteine O-methyltransferase Ste14
VALTRHADAILAAEFMRSGLYLVFLAVPVGAMVLHDEPTTADRRPLIQAVAVAASFMLVLLGLFPGAPLLLQLPVAWPLAALWVMVGCVALGVGSVICLGMNFSFRPEARRVCQRGPYQLVRHPIYLAEILVTMGALVAKPRMTMVGGELVFILLRIVRIRAEEQLLWRDLPDYREFEQSLPFRLVPLVW